MVVHERWGGGESPSALSDYITEHGLHGYNMTEDEVLFDDVYDLLEIIGR